ncbi:uncharacterized protein [Setaria viridis]|uniref:uncharacterized protein isoform X2 n=1 Tax=Setaria viridis TaxID=4556 RepID=UPI003B3A8D68
MDGHGDDGLQDLFPEGDPAFPAPAFDLLSQAESSGVPREGLQALDLNSQAEDWGDYSSYSDLLRGEGAPRGRGSRSLGLRAARSGGRGGGSGSRAGAGGSRGGGGGSRAGGGGSRAGAGGSRAGGGGASVTRPLFAPSLADGAGGSGGRSGGRGGGRARRSRGRGGRSTADYIEPYEVEDWVDVDDEDGAPQNVETIFPTSKGKFSECKKFRYGVPHYIDHLEEMFRDVVVDGSTSFVAGCEEDEDQDVDDVEEDDQYGTEGDVNAYEDSPMSYNTKKRGSTPSTKSTATSPSKKSKSPLLKMVSSLVDKLTTSDKDDGLLRSVGESIATSLNEKRQKLNPIKEMGESVKRCQQLALECGAAPESVEFYACRHLFKDPYEREFFCNIPTPEGRLRYLQRVCKENNLYE